MVVMDQFSWDDIFFSSCHLSGGQGIDLVRTNYLFVISRWERIMCWHMRCIRLSYPSPRIKNGASGGGYTYIKISLS